MTEADKHLLIYGHSFVFRNSDGTETTIHPEDVYIRASDDLGILERYRAALFEIAEQDPVEIALDPEWPKRIALAALKSK